MTWLRLYQSKLPPRILDVLSVCSTPYAVRRTVVYGVLRAHLIFKNTIDRYIKDCTLTTNKHPPRTHWSTTLSQSIDCLLGSWSQAPKGPKYVSTYYVYTKTYTVMYLVILQSNRPGCKPIINPHAFFDFLNPLFAVQHLPTRPAAVQLAENLAESRICPKT